MEDKLIQRKNCVTSSEPENCLSCNLLRLASYTIL